MSVYRTDDFASETRVLLWHFNAVVVTGAAIALVSSAVMAFNFQANQSPAVLGDKWKHTVYLKHGTYTIDLLALKKSNAGNLGLSLVNGDTGETTWSNIFDLYAAGDVANMKYQDTAVSVNRDGWYELTGEMASKNGASTGYNCMLSMISLWKQGI